MLGVMGKSRYKVPLGTVGPKAVMVQTKVKRLLCAPAQVCMLYPCGWALSEVAVPGTCSILHCFRDEIPQRKLLEAMFSVGRTPAVCPGFLLVCAAFSVSPSSKTSHSLTLLQNKGKHFVKSFLNFQTFYLAFN